MDAVDIAAFNSVAKAEPLRRRLEEAGIPAEIRDKSLMERLWLVARPVAMIKVTVHGRDLEKAAALLREWNTAGGPLDGAIRCPECSSFRVQYPQYARKSILPNLFLGFLSGIGLLKREFYCQDCYFTWPRNGRKPSRVRPHMAPYYFLEGMPQPEAGTGERSSAG